MKVINFVTLTAAIAVGLVLLLCGNLAAAILGVIWLAALQATGKTKTGKKAWKRYYRTNSEISRLFGEE